MVNEVALVLTIAIAAGYVLEAIKDLLRV